MIEAHRTFLKTMSCYKLHRYGTSSDKYNANIVNHKGKWIDCDTDFVKVIENYNKVELYTDIGNDGEEI